MSEQTYLDTSSQWGEYSYVTMEQVVIDYLANRDSDDYTFNAERHKIIYHAKQGIRKLYFDVLQEVRAIELDLGPNLQVVLPEDYVSYVRLSWKDENNVLYPITKNDSISIAKEYLQDHQYNILFDNNGDILEGNSNPLTNDPYNDSEYNKYTFCTTGFAPNVDMSERNDTGFYRIDKDNGVIKFSSDLYTKTVVLEYISDGLYYDPNKGETEAQIKVHKFAEQALIDYVYYSLIKQRRNVPANEKARARKEYHNSTRLAKRRLGAANRQELIKSFKKSNVWIKGR